jgi:predicted RNA-binding protein with RPS1 domain
MARRNGFVPARGALSPTRSSRQPKVLGGSARLTQNMTPEQQQPTSASPSKPLGGEIVALEDGRVRVRLETGTVGLLADTAGAKHKSSLKLGQHGRFQILRCDENGETHLSLVSFQDTDASPTVEPDVDELQNAIIHHHTAPAQHDREFPALDEQRIQNWLNRVEKTLIKLRRNRAKRLDEEFYSGS